ncbi:helix-turn-helix transcriptional regulator [Methylosinus sp. Sm6]|uniref:helix-turn-helix transcriptional regulator n=1 Tax=Methylosinus sp. Sm6 TaxID=2866948 RepID=UPI001C99FF6F|nr:helix-turn-helix transcriptional regulator [Methylosinus sp. Sm6]MBY6240124.1 helix-turn-helix transcriptional regulator [Methylosinus sp. Sm6]
MEQSNFATLSPRLLSDLIGSIYDCALDPSRWETTLLALAREFECEKAIVSLNDLRYDRAVIYKTMGWEPDWLKERTKHLPEIHARLHEWFARDPRSNEPFVASRILPREYVEASRYVRDCLAPQGLVDMAHLILMRQSAHFSELVLARHERRGVFADREFELSALLLPHLRRAITISNVLDARTIERARMTEALDALRCGVILTNERAAVLHVNRAAEKMLQRDGCLECVRGILRAKRSPAREEMKTAIAVAARDEAGIGQAGVAIHLTAPECSPVFAHILPLIGSELRTRLKPEATAAVFIGSPAQDDDGADLLRQAFDLTRGETRVVASLLAGRTLNETAAELGIAQTTVKTHLKAIFAKTGVGRQADLIRLASRLVPPIGG